VEAIKVAGASLNQTPLEWEGNLENIKNAIKAARAEDVDLLCLPELCITGYGCEDTFLAQWVVDEAINQLNLLLPHTAGIAVAVGLPLRHKGKLYNCACLLNDGTLLGIVAKQHLPNEGVHYESRWFSAWKQGEVSQINIGGNVYDIGSLTFTIKGFKVGFEICEDAWNPTSRPGWVHKKNAVDIILNPSASHFALRKAQLREKLVRESADQLNCLYVYVNLLGNEAGRMIYDGDILFGHQGRTVNKNKLLSFKDYNLSAVTYSKDIEVALTEENDLGNDDEYYAFTNALSLALFDYMRKSRSRGFVLSLSGGADSSACAVLVAHMIRRGIAELGAKDFLKKIGRGDLVAGLDNTSQDAEHYITHHLLTCAYQSSVNSSEATFTSAEQLANSVGATFYRWSIDEEVSSYTHKIETILQRKLQWETDDIALQNIQARVRSPSIWMLANIERKLLITTSNRSEGDVGYATMDGDTSGSIALLAGIDKHFLLKWLQWAEKTLGYTGLQWVNALAPSAELRPSEQEQTDEKDLMPYAVIVAIERLAIKDRKSPVEVYHELNRQKLESSSLLKVHIARFFRLWARNQWKRERTAPSFHVDDFNVDPRSWCRFPILSGGFEKELLALEALD